ncbi:MAG: hypothetical protein LBD59_12430 [Prevotellaceae bacterium]|jgi:hypothetical protein|nr:hypothetical protein [Prevotellaceae bacterium]
MKRINYYFKALILLSIACSSCAKNGDNDETDGQTAKITMVADAAASTIQIGFAGSGAASVDWGDGNRQNIELLAIPEYYEHTYGKTQSARNISIAANKLEFVDCNNNSLTELDLSNNSGLKYLYCSSNLLTSLDLSRNLALNHLECSNNRIASINTQSNIVLMTVYCNNNRLQSLNVSKNLALIDLNCDDNSIPSLNLAENTALETLTCSRNLLTSLNLSKNTALNELECDENSLTALDFTANTTLFYVHCFDNLLDVDALNEMFGTLHDNFNGSRKKDVYIGGNSGANICNRAIAVNKGWTVH